jgi:hypothetical protein
MASAEPALFTRSVRPSSATSKIACFPFSGAVTKSALLSRAQASDSIQSGKSAAMRFAVPLVRS